MRKTSEPYYYESTRGRLVDEKNVKIPWFGIDADAAMHTPQHRRSIYISCFLSQAG